MNKLWDNLKQPNIPLTEVSAGEERGDIKIHIYLKAKWLKIPQI